jgi:Tfp pilus assembly PilM family ATPase
MASRTVTAIGIDYDTTSIRAAKLTGARSQTGYSCSNAAVAEVKGDFQKDEPLVADLCKIRERMAPGLGDAVVSYVSGKQVFVAQIPFRKLPESEMVNALRLEIRKNLPFEAAGAAIDYQVVEGEGGKEAEHQVIVTAVANTVLNRHLRLMEKAGLKPQVVDTLPLAVANAFWANRHETDIGLAHVVMHVGPTTTTLAIDGNMCPFFYRSIYFSAAEIFAKTEGDPLSERERQRRIEAFGDEIVRSLSYYEKNHEGTTFSGVYLLGDFLSVPSVQEVIRERTALPIERINLAAELGAEMEVEAGKFDLALALAMRAE